MKETKIIKVIQETRGTTYVTEEGTYIKKTDNSFSVYDGDPKYSHSSIHFNVQDDGSLIVYEPRKGGQPVVIPAWMFKN